LLAAGGDLSPERLLCAYRSGIFPWYEEGSPILWWSPDPRAVLEPGAVRISRSLRRRIARGDYEITVDRAFGEVIAACAAPRPKSEGTWITDDMIVAYAELHRLGFAHSFETWEGGELVGGLYGLSLGRLFFGESMFSRASDASKVAFVYLAQLMVRWEFPLIDCQIPNAHLSSLGAVEIPRSEFLRILAQFGQAPDRRGSWCLEE
jgi:leucyl/phenylalanyl-tRNA--protein transferase